MRSGSTIPLTDTAAEIERSSAIFGGAQGDLEEREVRMNYPENDPKYWRGKANHARTVAEHLRDPRAREHILRAAASYEDLAALAEQQPLFG